MEKNAAKSIRISEEQKTILKKTFEKFRCQNNEALDILSQKTGLRPELIRKWFDKRRIFLGQTIDDDEIQILDDSNCTNTDLLGDEEYDEDSIELDNDDICGNVTSTCGEEMSLDAKAAEYNLLKQQMEVLQGQLSQMSQSLEMNTENPVNNYYYPSQGYNYHLQQQYPFPHHQLPYPPYNFYNGYSQGQLHDSSRGFWNLPYPPPDFRIILPATTDRDNSAEEINEMIDKDLSYRKEAVDMPVEKEAVHEVTESENSFTDIGVTEGIELNIMDDSCEYRENIQTKEETKTKRLEEKETLKEVDCKETKGNSDHDVNQKENEEKIDKPPNTTDVNLTSFKDFFESENGNIDPPKKYRLTPYKNTENLEKNVEETVDSSTRRKESNITERSSTPLPCSEVSLLSDTRTGENLLDKSAESGKVSDSLEESSNLSNVSFFEALEEVPEKIEKPDVVPLGDLKLAPKPFIVKKEPEVPIVKLGRKCLPTKSQQRRFMPITTLNEEAECVPDHSIPPPSKTPSKRLQSPAVTSSPSAPARGGAQKTSLQNSVQLKQQTRATVKSPRNVNQKQSDAPMRVVRQAPKQTQPRRGIKRSQTQSNNKVVRQKPPPASLVPKISNYTTITVTKVVDPPRPSIHPSKKPELQRILKMSNLSVSIKK